MSTPTRSLLSWWTSPRLWLRSILMLDDTPHSIALGAAIGMFVALTPTVGIQMAIVVAVAFLTKRLFHFNRVAALVAVYVSNPVTMLPVYWFNYQIGTLFVRGDVDRDQFASLLHQTDASSSSGWLWGLLERAWEFLVLVGPPLVIGSLVVAAVCSMATYPLIRWLLRVVRSEDAAAREPSAMRRSAQPALRNQSVVERCPVEDA